MSRQRDDVNIYTRVSDALYEDLTELCGQRIIHTHLWEDSLADSLEESNEGDTGNSIDTDERIFFDLDIYLEDGIYFELLGTLCYPSLEDEPFMSEKAVRKILRIVIESEACLDQVGMGEDEELVLVLGRPSQAMLYLAVNGWLVADWEELPI